MFENPSDVWLVTGILMSVVIILRVGQALFHYGRTEKTRGK